jgi:hypothetical protein
MNRKPNALLALLAAAALAWSQDPNPYGPIKIAPIKAPPPIAPPKSKPPAEPSPKPQKDPGKAHPDKPRCDRCEDLPKLLQELKEQEWLRDKFWSYTRFSDYQYMAADVGAMYCQVTCAMNQWLGKDPCPPRKCEQPRKPSEACAGKGAAMDMGTDPDTCQLFMCKPDKDGVRHKVPYNRADKLTMDCPEIVNYLEAHEKSHQRTCQALKAKGQSAFFDKPEFTALDEVKAYEAGIKALEKAINALAARCKEQGTRVDYRLPDDFKVTPEKVSATRDETQRIADALRQFQQQQRRNP